MRFPPFSAVCADCSTPNVLGLLTFVAGGAKFVWLRTFVKVASKRKRNPSRMVIDFDNPALTAMVALLGLLGMVIGEQFGILVQTKKLDVSNAASVCLVGERHDRPHRSEAP